MIAGIFLSENVRHRDNDPPNYVSNSRVIFTKQEAESTRSIVCLRSANVSDSNYDSGYHRLARKRIIKANQIIASQYD